MGVSLDLADYAAPEIPDSQNLLKNSIFAREWNGEIEPRLGNWRNMELSVPNPEGEFEDWGHTTRGKLKRTEVVLASG